MNDTIIYHPYKIYRYFLPFILTIGVLAFVFSGYCIPSFMDAFLLLGIGVGCTWITKVLYDSSNIAVFVESNGLRVVGGSYNSYRFFAWEKLQYAYYVRSFKGNLFLVLSPREVSIKEAKKLANRCADSLKVCVIDVVAIHIDSLQNISSLLEKLGNHILHINDY